MGKLNEIRSFCRWRESYKRQGMSDIERPHLNAVYVKQNETLEHAMKKFQIAFEHIKKGHRVMTEAQRKSDGQVPDVVCFDCREEIEVVATHGDEDEYRIKGRTVVMSVPASP